MVHCGFEPSAALGINSKFGDTFKSDDLGVPIETDAVKPTLVTGATGFIGWHVARKLLARGDKVRALVRRSEQSAGTGCGESCQGDLRDPESLERAVAGCGVVFHVAADYRLWAQGSGVSCYRSNVEGTRNLLNAARECRGGASGLYQHGGLHRDSRRTDLGERETPEVRFEEMTGPTSVRNFRPSRWRWIRRRRVSGGDRESDGADGRSRFQAHAHRQDRGGFCEGRDAGVSSIPA